MLSTKSEQFLIELRMYLLQRGKKDEDINAIVDELEVHLTEAEQRGQNVDHIIGKSRKQHMKNIGKELPVDKEGLLVIIPAAILVIVASMCFAPAVRGQFKISQNILLFGSLPLFLALAIFAFTLFKGLPKVYPSRKNTIFLLIIAHLITIGGWVGFYFWLDGRLDTDYFVATTMQNYIIASICVLIFILFASYTKSWLIIGAAFTMGIGPLLEHVIPPEINKDPMYITLTIIISIVIGILLVIYFYKKAKTTSNT
ncbi:NADH dehydrogenase subunit [Bacillus pseudomycoides]|uniref:NADH dehydrogenase subunit n=1 Tax=Bacillus TaxID=1386 RepID=UPI000BEB61D4|nr:MULTISPECIES: NADH dehydrogenase subunit [Bacillus]MCX2828275.1 NADH dehydrogenase subunit [Bacillus sp. DHT2]MDR4917361.1 NADH dehydrogenase subunit [Bacillus pseudomycoides]PDY00360.1 NADH dehydrogenase subunit [Bacillus pseudomycoides]PEK80683.1 NADH dehydrogenase subunit [Bacillus pseudomycoides]PEN08173.1 NADH dehydrogenase subunit [Bacillus pseudomycoides]